MLVDVLRQADQRSPNKVAVADGAQCLTYRRLTTLAAALRNFIRKQTACPRVGIMLPASVLFPAALFGTLWARRVAVPLNFLLSPGELSHVVKDAGIDLILTVRHFEKLASTLPARAVFLEDIHLKRRCFFTRLRRWPASPAAKENDTAVILYTSGTTAEPKGVELTHGNLYRNAFDAIHSLNIDARQTFLNILPPFHVFGLTTCVLVPVALTATAYAIPRFSPMAVIRTVREKQITVMLAIPSMYAVLLKSKSAAPDAFDSVHLALSGGEPLPERVRTGFQARFGVTLRQGYGLTETSPVIAACSVDVSRTGSVGKPVRNTEVRIVGPDGKDVPPGQTGEIVVRGPGVMKGYYQKPDATRSVLDADGWFHTGDIGRLDADRFLFVTGRKKEMLIIGGENVFPREIENALESHDDVLQAAVIGVPDDLRGEAPLAFVIPRHGADVSEDQLRRHARGVLAGFKVPKRIVIRDDLPTGPTGKILKRRLHELV